MADWNVPTNTTAYTSVLGNLKDRDVDAGTLFLNAPTNPVTGMIRYNRSTDLFEEYDGGWSTQVLSIAGGGTGASTAATARTALGLGTLAVQNSNSVTVTGGTISGVSLSGTLTGALTGNVTGNCTGNAGTVTNGVYTSGSYADPAWLTSLAATKLTGTIADARLSANVVLKASGIITNSTQPAQKMYRAASQTITASTETEIRPTDSTFTSGHDIVRATTSAFNLYAGGAGLYLVTVQVTFLAGAGTIRKLILNQSNTSTPIARDENVPSSSSPTVLRLSALVQVTNASTGTLYVEVYHDHTSTLDVYGADQDNTYFEAVKLW